MSSLRAMNVEAEQEMYPPCATPNRTRNATREPVEVAPRLFREEKKSQIQSFESMKVKNGDSQSKSHDPNEECEGKSSIKDSNTISD